MVSLPYYIFIAVVALLCVIFGTKSNKKNGFYLILTILILFCGLKEPLIYPDMENYMFFFNTLENNLGDDNIGNGYDLFNKIGHYVIGSFGLFCFIITIIYVGVFAKFILKYSPQIYLSLFVFTLVLYLQSFFILRQTMACAISVIALTYVLKRKIIWFIFWAVIAVTFHISAIIIFPIYFIFWVPSTKKNIIIMLLCGIMVLLAFKGLSNMLFASNEYYSRYLEWGDESSSIRLFMKVYILSLFLFSLWRKIFEKNINYLVLILFVISVLLYIGSFGLGIGGISRIRMYLDISDVLGLSLIICAARRHRNRQIINLMAFIYLIFLILSYNSFVTSGNLDGGYKLIF